MKMLEDGTDVRNAIWNAKEVDWLNSQLFLSAKPIVYLVNIGKDEYEKQKNKWLVKIKEWVDEKSPGSLIIPFSVAWEQELFNSGETQDEKEELKR
jgi:ribosome-binding ATPase YchF (GTP1/OBG family)